MSTTATPTGGGTAAPSTSNTSNTSNTGSNEEVLWSINDPAPDTSQDYEGGAAGEENLTNDPLEAAVAAIEGRTKTPSKTAKVPKDAQVATKGEEESAPEPKESSLRRIKVDGKEYELNEEQLLRFAQKGAAADKRFVDIAKERKAMEAMQETLSQKAEQIESFLQQLEENPIPFLTKKFGPQKAREIMEPFLAEQVREEMMPEGERRVLEAERRAQEAEQRWQKHEEQQRLQAEEAEANNYAEHYQRTIIQALETTGLPKNEQTVAEMAQYMKRAIAKGYDYTPEQIANLVKEDNTIRIGAFAEPYVTQAEAAKKSGDTKSLIGLLEQVEGLFGRGFINVVRWGDLARLRSHQPAAPKPILETPRNTSDEKKRKPYMSEEEWESERKRRVAAIDRGESVPDW